MASQPNDDFDLPEVTAEILGRSPASREKKLYLSPAIKKPRSRKWAEQYWPQPLGPGLRMLDYLILTVFAGSVLLFVKACSYAFFS